MDLGPTDQILAGSAKHGNSDLPGNSGLPGTQIYLGTRIYQELESTGNSDLPGTRVYQELESTSTREKTVVSWKTSQKSIAMCS